MKSLASKGLVVFVIAVLTPAICACKGGESAKMIQFCIDGEAGMLTLGRMIQETAMNSGMEFRDNGSSNDRDLRSIGVHPGYRLFSYSATRPDGLWLSATNLGLGAREAAVGFVSGVDPDESQAIFDGFVRLLGTHWSVRDVPEGRGAKKSPECEDH